MFLKEIFFGILVVLRVLFCSVRTLVKGKVQRLRKKIVKKVNQRKSEKSRKALEERVQKAIDNTITVTQACNIFDSPKSMVYKLIHEKKIKAYKDGNLWKIRKNSLEKYLAENSG